MVRFGDASAAFRSHSALLDRLNRVPLFVDFLRKNPGVPVFEDRLSLYRHVSSLVGNAPISYLEFGVHQGESIRQWSGLNTNPDSRLPCAMA